MASLCKNLRLARYGASYISHRLGATRTFSSNRPLLTRPLLQVKSQSSSTARLFAPRGYHNFAPEKGEFAHELVYREIRKEPPAHYLVQIDSFSSLEKHEIDKIETGVFEAGGYKWKLNIYHGDEETYNVPVKLALADTSALPKNWQVDAVFSICMKNQIDGCYHYVLERTRFDATKAEYGDFLIPKIFFTDPSYGYLKNDNCVLGAEVFVNKNDVVTEIMSLKNIKFPNYKGEFKILNFPLLKEGGGWVSHQTWMSEVFSVGGHEWRLKVRPSGWDTGHLSIYLEKIVGSDDVSLGDVDASYTITLKSQNDEDYHIIHTGSSTFSESGVHRWGWPTFIDLAFLNDPEKCYILNDCVHLELELSVDPIKEDSIPSLIKTCFGRFLC